MKTYSFDQENHVHLLDNKKLYGTTTVIDTMMPPPLAWWASGMALAPIGWSNVRNKSHDEYLPKGEGIKKAEAHLKGLLKLTPLRYYNLLQRLYRAHDTYKKERGKWGSKQHDKLEFLIKDAIVNHDGIAVKGKSKIHKWAEGKRFIFSECHVYSEELWLGGIVDILYEQDGKYYLADLKTSKSLYATQVIQMGMYDEQQHQNGFWTAEGKFLGPPAPISGYEVVNMRRNGDLVALIYRDPGKLRRFAKYIVDAYQTKKELDAVCRKGRKL